MVGVYTNRSKTTSKWVQYVDGARSIRVMRETRCEALAALAEELLGDRPIA